MTDDDGQSTYQISSASLTAELKTNITCPEMRTYKSDMKTLVQKIAMINIETTLVCHTTIVVKSSVIHVYLSNTSVMFKLFEFK